MCAKQLLEKYVLTTFSPALLTAAASVIGAQIGGAHVLGWGSIGFSIFIVAVVVIYHVDEILTLIRFKNLFHDECWQGEDPPEVSAEPVMLFASVLHPLMRRSACGRVRAD